MTKAEKEVRARRRDAPLHPNYLEVETGRIVV
jgi:hypothetical protein